MTSLILSNLIPKSHQYILPLFSPKRFPSCCLSSAARLSLTLSPLRVAFLSNNTMLCCVCVLVVRGRLFELRKRGHANTHTWDENLWLGLSHHCSPPLSINILAQTSSFTLQHHQTGFCLFLHNHSNQTHAHTHTYLHTSAYKIIAVSHTKCPNYKRSSATMLVKKHKAPTFPTDFTKQKVTDAEGKKTLFIRHI